LGQPRRQVPPGEFTYTSPSQVECQKVQQSLGCRRRDLPSPRTRPIRQRNHPVEQAVLDAFDIPAAIHFQQFADVVVHGQAIAE
jgi:hypothetical protein